MVKVPARTLRDTTIGWNAATQIGQWLVEIVSSALASRDMTCALVNGIMASARQGMRPAPCNERYLEKMFKINNL
jgi:hypothetical protein